MSKNTYQCACGRTFSRSSTAEVTGCCLPDYGPGHDCFGCPYVLELMKGWGEERRVTGHECRAQKLSLKTPEENITYQTGAWYDLTNHNTASVYTLDLPWVLNFIQAYLELEGAAYRPKEGLTAAEMERYCRGAGLSLGRRIYSFGFTPNKKGMAAKVQLFQRFFDANGIALDTLGPKGDRQKILNQIEAAKAAARQTTEEAASVAITYPTSPAELPPVELREAPAPGRTIADVTAEIRFYKAQTVQSVIEIGKRLTEAKGMLEHGQWLDWLEGSVEISQRTAQRFMQLADTFPNASPVSHLSYSKLLALLAVPEEDREEFLEVTHNVGGEEKTVAEMSKRELEKVIRERDHALKEQERLKMLADASEKTAEIRQKKLEEKGQELYEVKSQAAAEKLRYERELKRLESRPVEVAIQGPSEEEIERIREEARAEALAEAETGPGYRHNLWLENLVKDRSQSYFWDAVKSAVYVLTATAAQKTGRQARETLEQGITFLQTQIDELRRQCNMVMIHEPPGELEEDFDFDP